MLYSQIPMLHRIVDWQRLEITEGNVFNLITAEAKSLL